MNREEVLGAIAAGLPGQQCGGQLLQQPGVARSEVPAFAAHITEQLVKFTGYRFDGENGNAIIDVMRPLGYRLYDPQVNQRFE